MWSAVTQSFGGEEQLMIDYVKNFHPREPGLFIIDNLREISIIKQEFLNLYSKLSLGS